MRLSVAVFGVGIFFSFLVFGICSTWSQSPKPEVGEETPLVLSLADTFPGTTQPPVQFLHGLHTQALKPEGCGACHPSDEKRLTSFSFPKNKNGLNKEKLADSYHTACIGCHTKLSKGPDDCKGCHVSPNLPPRENRLPAVRFTSYLHDLHSGPSQKDCAVCHHTYENSSCRKCHPATGNGIPSYKTAAHLSCLNCHLKCKAGPTSCKGCHSGAN